MACSATVRLVGADTSLDHLLVDGRGGADDLSIAPAALDLLLDILLLA